MIPRYYWIRILSSLLVVCVAGALWVPSPAVAFPRGREFFQTLFSSPDADGPEAREILEENIRPCKGSVIDTIIIAGNQHTRRNTILREMATRQGALLDEELLIRDDSYIRGMGFFSWVEVSVRPSGPGRCRVFVQVTERPGLFMKYPYPTVDYHLKKGVSYGFRWKVKNFRGVGEQLAASFEKRRDKEHEAGITWNVPWVGGKRLKLSVNLFNFYRLEEPEREDFIKDRYGANLSFGLPLTGSLVRQVWLVPTISLENRYSRLSIPGNLNYPAGIYIRQVLLSYGFTISYDSRDNGISPLRGMLSAFSFRRYYSVNGMEQQYSFSKFTQNMYLPVKPAGTLIFSLAADNRDGALPAFYEMGMGGYSDLRGFRNDYLRGTSKLISTLQLRKGLYGPVVFNIPWVGKFDLAVNGVVFVDNGALMDSFADIGSSRYYTTGGCGFEILSPIQDVMRLEIAMGKGDAPGFYLTSSGRF
ncbi:MAG: BamA/TamA family outer membrane protein [Candidatus Krumholzibacteriota bacterium]|nr:BamA/TamA family outer membrane protein [Candidatus Krumholzibacteriota bacterium]